MRTLRLRDKSYVFYVSASITLLAIGLLMLLDTLNAGTLTPGGLVLVLSCPGGLVVIFALATLIFARRLVGAWRHPNLVVTPKGITSPYSRYPAPVLPWSGVKSLACYDLKGTVLSSERWYLLAMGDSSEPLRPIHEVESVSGHDWYFAPRPDVLLALPLSEVFLQPAPEKGLALLARLERTFAPEIAHYGIIVRSEPLDYQVPESDD